MLITRMQGPADCSCPILDLLIIMLLPPLLNMLDRMLISLGYMYYIITKVLVWLHTFSSLYRNSERDLRELQVFENGDDLCFNQNTAYLQKLPLENNGNLVCPDLDYFESENSPLVLQWSKVMLFSIWANSNNKKQ